MARTALSVQTVVVTGLEATYTAANVDGHAIAGNTGELFLHVINGDAADKTVTIQTPAVFKGIALADVAVVVTAGEERLIGPFDPSLFNQADGTVYVDYSATTSVTVAALKLPRP